MLINRQESLVFHFGLKTRYKEYHLKLQVYNNYIISACKNTLLPREDKPEICNIVSGYDISHPDVK